MRSAGRLLAHHLRPLDGLQRIGQILAARKRLRAGQDVDRLRASEALAGELASGPELLRGVGIATVDVAEMNRRWLEEVAGDERDRLGLAALVVAQVDDQRAGIGDAGHHAADRLAHFGLRHRDETVDDDAGDIP